MTAPRAYVVRPGDVLESLDGKRRAEVVAKVGGGSTYRDVLLRNPDTGRSWHAGSRDLWKRYRVVSRGAESDIVREAGEVR